MRVFATLICILGCILFTLMSACFGWVGMIGMQDTRNSNLIGAVVFLGIAGALLFVAFLLGREAKRRLSN
jgi:hypothetical protein